MEKFREKLKNKIAITLNDCSIPFSPNFDRPLMSDSECGHCKNPVYICFKCLKYFDRYGEEIHCSNSKHYCKDCFRKIQEAREALEVE